MVITILSTQNNIFLATVKKGQYFVDGWMAPVDNDQWYENDHGTIQHSAQLPSGSHVLRDRFSYQPEGSLCAWRSYNGESHHKHRNHA
jgi:hypothetical protein